MSSILKIAVMAVGGQGGGVLSSWIAQLAENCNYHAQVTSVAGVAQRTGATIYYIEIAPQGSGDPVFALSPSPGDVDVLIAAELMEAGRAVQRGFVTPERTVLITSTHRILAVSEKQTPGDGRSDSVAVRAELGQHARHIVAFDMDAIAKDTESFISASLFGALAKSNALPFSTQEFRSVLESAAKSAASNLAAFEAALFYEDENAKSVQTNQPARKPQSVNPDWVKLLERAETSSCQAKVELLAGLQKTVDYQDIAYGYEYLDR
ncbi:2-oxoacid:acceptor oxidoreductase family protein, partial [Planktotalea sp.]|uniref:2-oxoacid:acceptor oxidoreductase family protein n=1 Tax=Planktotalea sp. TaxID=2029877 RepID=UPI003297622A